MNEDYPYAAPWRDRHGNLRWRFRRGKKVIYLPGEPGQPDFEDAYKAAIQGLPAPKKEKAAVVVPLPSASAPRSFKAAWRLYTRNYTEWKTASSATKEQQSAVSEHFFATPVDPQEPELWGDIPVEALRRRHLKKILADMSDRPHAGRHRLTVIRKMILVALDEEWIETDPSYRLKYRPATQKGFRPWTEEELLLFEERWPLGTTPRLAYEIALWAGARRCDLAKLPPSALKHKKITFTPQKTQASSGVEVVTPISPSLQAALDQTDLSGETILTTEYGKPFSPKSLTGRMRAWTRAAKIEGCTLHGLRKTLGKRVASSGGSSKQNQAILGHETLQQTELYSKDAEREKLAEEAMEKVVTFVQKQRKERG